jgi:hypothetical protein
MYKNKKKELLMNNELQDINNKVFDLIFAGLVHGNKAYHKLKNEMLSEAGR